ncbi:unnamed protein product [Echinostoma caproni]|uniref:Rhodanese domain-containing protein n=1 Tax=Echinostoma caproni TaxID=27848 RepID=A0A183AJB0_9TREM|nr:unnamed protein product [Echinostoma caproni]
MEADDVTSLIELTQLFSSRTPQSFRSEFLPFLFGNTVLDTDDERSVMSATHLCLPVTVQEVFEAQAAALKFSQGVSEDVPNEFKQSIRFLLVDCRPAEQYNAGHLNTAFFVDSQLLLSEPDAFQSTVEALLQSQRRALNAGSHAAGEHITFLSSGRPEEDQVTNMVVATFLRLNIPYVSLVQGGYTALHETLGPQQISRSLVSHNPNVCISCQTQSSETNNLATTSLKSGTISAGKNPSVSRPTNPPVSTAKTTGGLFSKISGTLFKGAVGYQKTPVSAGKADHATGTNRTQKTLQSTPSQSSVRLEGQSTGALVKQSQTNNEHPASYRNTASVFSIDEDEDIDEDFTPPGNESSSFSSGMDGAAESAESPTRTEQGPKATSWLKRLTAAIHVSESESLPPGDIPTRPGGLDSSEPGDLIDTTQWSRRSELHGVFDCQFIDSRGRLAEVGYLILAERHLLVLRDHTPRSPARFIASIGSVVQSAFGRTSDSGEGTTRISARSRHAVLLRSAPLALISRITANRRLPECITFHYSGKDPTDLLQLNEPAMGLRDRLYLPQAGEAVRMIKLAICHLTMA